MHHRFPRENPFFITEGFLRSRDRHPRRGPTPTLLDRDQPAYYPDEENHDPEGHRDEVVEARLGAAFFNERGLPSAVPEGSFFDLFPLSVLTTSSLDSWVNSSHRAASTPAGSA
jgi:hypothetical protein